MSNVLKISGGYFMYTENNFKNGTQVLNSFFAKPMTLVVAITFAFQFIYTFIVGGFSIDPFAACSSIGFFMLYFRAKSNNPFTNFNAPLTLIKVVAIITAILNGVALAFMLFLAFFSIFISSHLPEISNFLFLLFIIISGFLLFNLFYSISFSVFSNSLKKTSVSLELCKKGSLFSAISGILYALIVTVCAIVCIVSAESILEFIKKLLTDFISAEFSISIDEGAYFGDLSNMFGITSLISTLTTFIVPAVNIVIMSVYAVHYYIFIKNVEKNYKPARPDYVTPYQNVYGNNQKTSVDYKKISAPDPMYAAVLKEMPKDRIKCNHCNSIIEKSLTFCPNCGNKIVKTEEN